MSEVPKERADNIPSPESISGPRRRSCCQVRGIHALRQWMARTITGNRTRIVAGHFGISNRKGSEDRLELALVLRALAEHAAKPLTLEDAKRRNSAPNPLDAEVGDAAIKREAELLKRLSGTLGKMSTSYTVHFPAELHQERCLGKRQERGQGGGNRNKERHRVHPQRDARNRTMEDLAPRASTGKQSSGAIVWVMQLVAKEIFRETGKRPNKHGIRIRLEEDG